MAMSPPAITTLLIIHLVQSRTESMAGALVGGAFLSAFLQVAFDRVASRENNCAIHENTLR
ncbi:hypothetical protein CFP56_037249 [Quercus suber]|uniref:Uncharacterized protein n=1 Tax=Quercus suber TaxID=58331 RepID=A0AAW0J6C5_QUESU